LVCSLSALAQAPRELKMKRRHHRVEMPARGKNFSASSMARAWRSATIAIVLFAMVVAKARAVDRVAKAAMVDLTMPRPANCATCAARAATALAAKPGIMKKVAAKQNTATVSIMNLATLTPVVKDRVAKPAVAAIAKKALAVVLRNVADQSRWNAADVAHHVPIVAMIVADRQRWPAIGMVAIAVG
jgi:hypothetical protein